MASLSRLCGHFAHDFNNLLTVISTSAAVLEAPVGGQQALSDIAEAADRGRDLVRKLMAFGKRQALEPMMVDVPEQLESLFDDVESELPSNIQFAVRQQEEGLSVRIDPTQLRLAVQALIDNARLAMPDGGRLVVDVELVSLVGCLPSDPRGAVPHVMIAVTDSGCGMSEAVRRDACKPFFTTDANRSGMGLSAVYGTVRQSGGALRLDSAPGEGTTATIYLPQVSSTEVIGPEPDAWDDALLSSSKLVLLVDDDSRVRRALRRLLELEDYRVIEADSGRQALRLAKTYRGELALVLTDVVMPGMSGIEFARRLRQQPGHPPILLTSGYAPTDLDDGSAEGLPFIQKPSSRDELLSAVAATIERFVVSADAPPVSVTSSTRRTACA